MEEATVGSYGSLSKNRKTITMVGVILAMLLAALDQTIVGTALPRIVTDLGGANHLTWVVTAYMLASTVTVPIYGKLSDLFGRKWFFFSGVAIFLISSALCGLSHNMIQLVIFRALQGIGAGAIMGNAFAIIGDLFDARERARWQGMLGGVFGLASVIGPALGGWLTDNASWEWVFYVNIPIGLLALAVIGYSMPHIVAKAGKKIIDYWGGLFLIGALVPLLLGLSWGGNQYAWSSPTILSLLVGAGISLAAFLITEKRAREPIIPLSLFKNSIFSISILATFLTGAAMFGAVVYIPLFAQLVQGVSATRSGAIMTPLMIGLIAASAISGQLIARTGKYKPTALLGGILLVAALVWLATLHPSLSGIALSVRTVVLGVSLGFLMPVFNIVVQNAFERDKIGVVTSTTQMFRSVGATVGVALFGVIFSASLSSSIQNLPTTAYGQSVTGKIDVASPEIIQGMLFPENQAQIREQLQHLPAGQQATATNNFNEFIATAKQDMTDATNRVFILSASLASLALVAIVFLKQIPLRSHREEPKETTETGQALAVGLSQSQAKDEPTL